MSWGIFFGESEWYYRDGIFDRLWPDGGKDRKGGTVYSLKLLPFGGACQMLGEDGEEEGKEPLTANPCGQEFPSLRRDRCST